jgi:hypothetical protein
MAKGPLRFSAVASARQGEKRERALDKLRMTGSVGGLPPGLGPPG